MVSKQQEAMAEVTRLTRDGRLGEAMALLQGRVSAHERTLVNTPLAVETSLQGLVESLEPLGAGAWLKTRPTPFRREHHAEPVQGALFETRHFANRSGSRAYRLYVPRSHNGQALPLVVMLHGCQQSSEDFATGTRMNSLAEELGFVVAYPEQSYAANQSRCWNWFVPGDQARNGGEPSLIAGITQQIMQDVAVDPARVFIAGLSAGGAAAAIMGSTYPELYAGVCVHSGLACGAARDMSSAFSAMQAGGAVPVGLPDHPRRTIVFHGDRDHTVNIVNGDQVIAQSMGSGDYRDSVTRGQSAGGMSYTRTVHAGLGATPVLEHWVLHGLGHAWSGGSSAGSFTDPRGPDASREMMRFFLDENRSAADY